MMGPHPTHTRSKYPQVDTQFPSLTLLQKWIEATTLEIHELEDHLESLLEEKQAALDALKPPAAKSAKPKAKVDRCPHTKSCHGISSKSCAKK